MAQLNSYCFQPFIRYIQIYMYRYVRSSLNGSHNNFTFSKFHFPTAEMFLWSLVRVQHSEHVAVTVHSHCSCTTQTTHFYPADGSLLIRNQDDYHGVICVIMELRAGDKDLVTNEGEKSKELTLVLQYVSSETRYLEKTRLNNILALSKFFSDMLTWSTYCLTGLLAEEQPQRWKKIHPVRIKLEMTKWEWPLVLWTNLAWLVLHACAGWGFLLCCLKDLASGVFASLLFWTGFSIPASPRFWKLDVMYVFLIRF